MVSGLRLCPLTHYLPMGRAYLRLATMRFSQKFYADGIGLEDLSTHSFYLSRPCTHCGPSQASFRTHRLASTSYTFDSPQVRFDVRCCPGVCQNTTELASIILSRAATSPMYSLMEIPPSGVAGASTKAHPPVHLYTPLAQHSPYRPRRLLRSTSSLSHHSSLSSKSLIAPLIVCGYGDIAWCGLK